MNELTTRIVAEEIISNFKTLEYSIDGETGIEFNIKNLLKQIRDELICVEEGEPPARYSYFGREDIYISIIKIVNVFNNYLNKPNGIINEK